MDARKTPHKVLRLERERINAQLQAALARMDEEGFAEFKAELARLDVRARHAKQARRALNTFESDHPGNPLGKGMPLGRSLREDGESHRSAWMRIVRGDPCSYCGRPGGTVDHVEARRGRPARGIGGAHSWLNFTGACEPCNRSKANHHLLLWLARRSIRA